MAEQVIDLNVERQGEVTLVRVGGEVDMLTTPPLSECLMEQLNGRPEILVLDLRNVVFLGSSGLAAFVQARDDATTNGVKLRLVISTHAVERPFQATGLTDLFDIYRDLDSALQR